MYMRPPNQFLVSSREINTLHFSFQLYRVSLAIYYRQYKNQGLTNNCDSGLCVCDFLVQALSIRWHRGQFFNNSVNKLGQGSVFLLFSF